MSAAEAAAAFSQEGQRGVNAQHPSRKGVTPEQMALLVNKALDLAEASGSLWWHCVGWVGGWVGAPVPACAAA